MTCYATLTLRQSCLQTWDLLRIVVHGFLSFCKWFFTSVSPDGRYFVIPLRINGSALESIFSVLKHTSGGNLSAIAYSPALGRLINRKSITQNKNSEKGYRDIKLNLDGGLHSVEDQIFIQCTITAGNVHQFVFPSHVAQSSLGGRQGSNACTIIAVKFGDYCMQHKLDVSLLWTQLPQLWTSLFINAICDGNEMYDKVYGATAVYLDAEDVAQSLGTDCNVQSVSAVFGFTNANNFADLVLHVSNIQQPSYGVLTGCDKSVGIFVQTNGLCAMIDSHVHNNTGAIIMMAPSPSTLINAFARMLLEQNLALGLGTFTWVQYSHE